MSKNKITTHYHPVLGAVRTVERDGQVAFVLADVCRALGIDQEQAKSIVGASNMTCIDLDLPHAEIKSVYYDCDGRATDSDRPVRES